MNTIFADSVYWIAIINDQDQWHQMALDAQSRLSKGTILVTTEEVLTEVLTALSGYGAYARKLTVDTVEKN